MELEIEAVHPHIIGRSGVQETSRASFYSHPPVLMTRLRHPLSTSTSTIISNDVNLYYQVEEIIRPLGLFRKRAQSAVRLSEEYLDKQVGELSRGGLICF